MGYFPRPTARKHCGVGDGVTGFHAPAQISPAFSDRPLFWNVADSPAILVYPPQDPGPSHQRVVMTIDSPTIANESHARLRPAPGCRAAPFFPAAIPAWRLSISPHAECCRHGPVCSPQNENLFPSECSLDGLGRRSWVICPYVEDNLGVVSHR